MKYLKTSPSYRWMTSRRLGYFLCFVGFVWGLALMNMTLISDNNKESQHLKVQFQGFTTLIIWE